MINNTIIDILKSREFYSEFNENPRTYAEDANAKGSTFFNNSLNSNFEEIDYKNTSYVGNEFSPFLNLSLGIKYPTKLILEYISDANTSKFSWNELEVNSRISILKNCLDAISKRFFDVAYATMHTTGQSFIMSFQASGPHAADRALETLAVAQQELNRYNSKSTWVKDFGKFQLQIEKDFLPISKGIGLVIGCSTFPTWNSVTGIFANLACGNPVIVKPHPKSILPMAIYVAEIRKVLKDNGIDANLIQLAVDTVENPITKDLVEHESIKLIDYTGGNAFGDYIESKKNKTVFTEKAGVNCSIVDSTDSIEALYSNLAFSLSLYSGQMCTAPQNIFVSENGVRTVDGVVSYDDFCIGLANAVTSLIDNPKAGAGTAGAIQNTNTLQRVQDYSEKNVILKSKKVENSEFPNAITASPLLLRANSGDVSVFAEECFGPIAFVIKTKDTNESLEIAKNLATTKGAITCLAFTTDEKTKNAIRKTMNEVFVPVSFNLKGAAFVNQHAAFSDFHVTGGNPAGNATFTNADYINRRFIWVGNRYM